MTYTELKETILIVEDDVSIRTGLELNLRAEGYKVYSASDVASGRKLALRWTPDLIVLDLMLPDGSGLDVLRALRRQGLEMQVLILSAMGLESDKVRGLKLGADDYMTKPFGLSELLARIDAALRRTRRQNAGTALGFGPVEIHRATREVSRAGDPIKLTSKEFDLLLYMAERPDRVFSRHHLLQLFWGQSYRGTTRTVDNFICNLRGKLEQDPAKPQHLLTVHGVGYRLKG